MKIFPIFLEERIRKFHEEKIHSRKNKKHIVIGNIEPNRKSIILSNNDYLSIATNSDIIKSQIDYLKSNKDEVIMSAVFLRGHNLKKEFELDFARFVGFEDAILCQSGWDANIGLLQSIANDGVMVYIDFNAHASLWEGIKSSGATAKPFLHNSFKHLEKLVKRNGSGIIIVDSLYSAKGDIAPLKEICDLSIKYNCILIVDESHSIGIYGKNGCGLVRNLNLLDKVDFLTISLAKTFSGRAGIITCSKEFAEYFPFVSGPAIFSSTLLSHELIGLKKTLDVIKNLDKERKKLFWNAKYLRNGLIKLGYKIASVSQIISIETGDDKTTEEARDFLEEHDIFGAVFCYPATPKNKAVIRLTMNSKINKDQIDYIIEVCKKMKKVIPL